MRTARAGSFDLTSGTCYTGARPGAGKAMVTKVINPTDKHVGSKVRMRRMMLDMSQTDLADAIGVTFQQVQKYEKGVNRISASRLQGISQILQVPIPFFFDGVPRMAGQPRSNGKAPFPTYVSEFLATSDGLRLVGVFSRIRNATLKRSIIRLVEQITGDR
jgi:transcriptional regulator with XRE-family HTH domain